MPRSTSRSFHLALGEFAGHAPHRITRLLHLTNEGLKSFAPLMEPGRPSPFRNGSLGHLGAPPIGRGFFLEHRDLSKVSGPASEDVPPLVRSWRLGASSRTAEAPDARTAGASCLGSLRCSAIWLGR